MDTEFSYKIMESLRFELRRPREFEGLPLAAILVQTLHSFLTFYMAVVLESSRMS